MKIPCLVKSESVDDTILIGQKIAILLEKGSVLALRGSLGAGKTCLVKGIARFFRIDEEITSPTYTIVSEYEGTLKGEKIPFFHIDAYRLQGEDDFYSLGGEEYLYGGGIAVVEWSERIKGALPEEALIADIEVTKENERLFRIYRGKP